MDNWLAFLLINVVWIISLLLMRRRYRNLLGKAIEALDDAHKRLTPYVGTEGEVRRQIGFVLSHLCMDARIFPWERHSAADVTEPPASASEPHI